MSSRAQQASTTRIYSRGRSRGAVHKVCKEGASEWPPADTRALALVMVIPRLSRNFLCN